MNGRHLEELFFKTLMVCSILLVTGTCVLVIGVVFLKGAGALTPDMLLKSSEGGYYLGRGGGILNAILGSLYLAGGAILIATALALPIAWFLNQYAGRSRLADMIRFSLDAACGIPSLVYGAVLFLLMVAIGQRASLLWGCIAVAIFITPLLARAMDEMMQMVPSLLKEASYGLGATDFETLLHVVTRQALPGLVTAVLLAFGRGIGDAAAVMFTAGYTDRIPVSVMDPVATLPLAIFYQINSPLAEVQSRAYASGVVLLVIVLASVIASRLLSKRLTKNCIR
ncbi:MAG: ABC transporter permease subunit [Methanoregula sp.]